MQVSTSKPLFNRGKKDSITIHYNHFNDISKACQIVHFRRRVDSNFQPKWLIAERTLTSMKAFYKRYNIYVVQLWSTTLTVNQFTSTQFSVFRIHCSMFRFFSQNVYKRAARASMFLWMKMRGSWVLLLKLSGVAGFQNELNLWISGQSSSGFEKYQWKNKLSRIVTRWHSDSKLTALCLINFFGVQQKPQREKKSRYSMPTIQ